MRRVILEFVRIPTLYRLMSYDFSYGANATVWRNALQPGSSTRARSVPVRSGGNRPHCSCSTANS